VPKSPQKDSYHKDGKADASEGENHRADRPPRVGLQIHLGNVVAVLLQHVRQRAPRTHQTLRLVTRIDDLVGGAVEAVPAAALALDVLFGLAARARQTAHRLGRLWVLVAELDVLHAEVELAELVLADLDPLVLARRDLLEVDDVVASWSVAVGVEIELVAGEAAELDVAEVFEELGAFGGAHGLAESGSAAAHVLVHVPGVRG
jgi:hypothetical protein